MIDTARTELGELASDAIRDIAFRSVGAQVITDYVDRDLVTWDVFEDGGWDRIGVAEEDGGGGATLRDLVEVASVWGYYSIPLPLLESMVVRRWSAAARESSGPVTVSVSAATLQSGSGLVPFGALAGTSVARSLGEGSDILVAADASVPEPFAIALRPAIVPWLSDLTPTARRELEVLWAAETVGAAQRLVDLSVAYSKQRVQFDQQIGSFQAVKHRLANMHIDTQLAESAVLWASLEPEQAHRTVSFAVDAAIRVAQSAIQVHGAMGFTWELGLHYFLRTMLVRRELLAVT